MAGTNFFFLPVLIFISAGAQASSDEELSLIRESHNVSLEIHQQNVANFGLKGKDCNASSDLDFLLGQLRELRDGRSVKCGSGVALLLGSVAYKEATLDIKSDNPKDSLSFQESLGVEKATESSGKSEFNPGPVFEEYARIWKDYRPNEEDSLFELISKAYVRNLRKIFPLKDKE